ncbi:hypothetical protein BGZ74_006588 [Mortierella antarctica]|nr:hypothetical protein BGZ74_006588 [Mortierella antarctica]KAG0360281.1 hypothetical protein BG005_011078 [Podila minutissima]
MTTHSAEDQLVLDQLVYRVCRAFYEPRYIVVMDVINKMKQIKDEELALTLKLTKREIHKICGKLKEDRLIKDITKHEARKPDQRPIPNTYYYLDYKIFVDVVKYKIHKMGKKLDANMQQAEVESTGHRCPACGQCFTMVDIMNDLNMETGKFRCPYDSTDLEDEDPKDEDQGQEQKTKLRENTKPIVDLLKLTDNIVIEQYTESMVHKNAQSRTHDDDDLAFAEDGGQQQGEIQIEFQYDNDKAAKKAKEKEAMKKRQQNAVPSWHAWSTVSGEMTALGAEAAKRDLLVDDHKADGEGEVLENDLDGDDYYKQYYENLAQEQQEESQDTLNVNGETSPKRSLDDSDDSSRKRFREDAATPSSVNGEEVVEDEEEDAFEYPMISIGGTTVSLLDVTDEHRAQMTPEEYQVYYDACAAYQ